MIFGVQQLIRERDTSKDILYKISLRHLSHVYRDFKENGKLQNKEIATKIKELESLIIKQREK